MITDEHTLKTAGQADYRASHLGGIFSSLKHKQRSDNNNIKDMGTIGQYC